MADPARNFRGNNDTADSNSIRPAVGLLSSAFSRVSGVPPGVLRWTDVSLGAIATYKLRCRNCGHTEDRTGDIEFSRIPHTLKDGIQAPALMTGGALFGSLSTMASGVAASVATAGMAAGFVASALTYPTYLRWISGQPILKLPPCSTCVSSNMEVTDKTYTQDGARHAAQEDIELAEQGGTLTSRDAA